MKNWPHQIIFELLDKYSETTTDLTRFVTETLGIDAKDRIKAEKIKTILDVYEGQGYLTYKAMKHVGSNQFEEKVDSKSRFGTFVDGVEETFDNNRIEAQLTSIKGLDYAIKLKEESEAHDSIMRTNKSSRRNNWITPILALVTAFIACYALYGQILFQRESEQKLQELQTKVLSIENRTQLQQTDLANVHQTLEAVKMEVSKPIPINGTKKPE